MTEDRIFITGAAVTTARFLTAGGKDQNDSVYGLPAQSIVLKSEDSEFEIVPYFTQGVHSIGTGGHKPEFLKQQSEKWWAANSATAKTVKVGDSIAITYQGGDIIIQDFRIRKIIGPGTVGKE